MTKRPSLHRWLLAFSALSALAGHAAAQETAQGTLSLNGTWSFALAKDENAAEALKGFQAPDFAPGERFTAIPVPSNWTLQGFEPPHYKPFKKDETASQGFYIDRFTLPADWGDKRVLLHFGGVWSSAEVWLNGEPLGRHDSGFTSFAYDVTSKLKKGDNVLAVRVRQAQHDYEFDTNDDWTLPGIYRDVTLEAMSKKRWLDRVDAQTTFDTKFHDADLKVRVMVGDAHRSEVPGNYVGPGDPYKLRLTLTDKAGHVVKTSDIDVPAHYQTDRETAVDFHVTRPAHWTAETPDLYDLKVDLLEGGQVVHTRDLKVGFRQISTAGGVFRVNGVAVKLRGVDRHDEYPDVGRATTEKDWLQDLTTMKAANINFIRTSHYPPAEGFLDLCDRMGFYVDDEVPMGEGGNAANDPSYTDAVALRSLETVQRDIDHPSIILWSIGNEDPLTALHMASIRMVKGLDPTRPVLMPWRADLWLPPEIDILAPHYYTAKEYDALGKAATRPIITTEYTHAYGNDGFGGLEDRWKALTQHATGAGGAIWMWADQGIELRTRAADGHLDSQLEVVPDGWDGIVDSYRQPTRDYWETQAVYAQAFPAVSQVKVLPKQTAISIPIRNDFDFTDLKTVSIDWTLMADDRKLAGGTVSVSAQPHTSRPLSVPVTAIGASQPGTTYTVALTFKRPDGSEITRRSVELLTPPHPVPHAVPVPVDVAEGAQVTVTAGAVRYVFDPATGQLASASAGEETLTGLHPTIWRPLNANETVLKNVKTPPDLNVYTARATAWKVVRTGGGVDIRASVAYTVDDKDGFTADYDYAVDTTGALHVHYSLRPQVQIQWLPFVGMAFDAPWGKTVRWLGLGPLDAFPDEKAATPLGVWSRPGSEAFTGTKAMRWLDIDGARIENNGWFYADAAHPGRFSLLSAVAGRPSKGHMPEDNVLSTTTGQPFSGDFTLRLQPRFR